MPLRDQLTQAGLSLTPSEAKIVQVLLSDYPVSGLGTATSLARRAGVSDPTVVRLVVKLGYEGFHHFQSKLLEELEARLHSPLLMMEAKRHAASDRSLPQLYLDSVLRRVDETRAATPAQTYDHATRLIRATKGQVVLLGGRFSRNIASMFSSYLEQFRPGVHDLGVLAPVDFDRLIDLGKRDLLVVFDYRRYQSDVIRFARQAAERGVTIMLFTDPWRSPIAEVAEVVLVAPIEADSPYDTMAPAVAQMEAVLAHAVATMDETVRRRIEAIEKIRHANAVTIDESEPEPRTVDRRRKSSSRTPMPIPGKQPSP
ncbi:MAG TPA: MurR/RpiR family transcriptional regulator [Geminicoccus sp.]|jgi:DNA-binding MurR/RpiR family transcriptional regulator|uniref:MurR/RpiR family transcriptional regulator n=1 Tax=Geminicoccus sp. TaxID=2024832 RepID=UPI002E319296|nr:MurR/RpiR family transcriptional regulator [Geminicoccus sp.]HEX2526097.1 MurR/RpiR family transcriptional regulator [Geminicoccus sp.]